MSVPSSVMRPLRAAPGGDLGEAVQRAQQRRLARARRADQREHLALAHRQADVAHDPVLAVGEPHRLDRMRSRTLAAGRRAVCGRAAAGGGCAGRRRYARRRTRRRHVRFAVDDDPAHRGWHQRVHQPSCSASSEDRRRSRRRALLRAPGSRGLVRRVTSAFRTSTITSSTNAAA